MLETAQVRLRLRNTKQVEKALRKRNALKMDAKGPYLPIQFNAQTFEFRPGVTITVGKTVANALLRSSGVIDGEDIDGEIIPALEIVGQYQLGDQDPEEAEKITLCPVCKKDCKNFKILAAHLQRAHVLDRPDLYKEAAKTPKADYTANVDEPLTAEQINGTEIDDDELLKS